MGRTVFVAPRKLEKYPHRAVAENGVRNWSDGIEVEFPLIVTVKDAASIRPAMTEFLNIILAIRVSLPDMDLSPRDRIALRIFDSAKDKERLAIGVMGYGIPVRLLLSFSSVERPQDTSLGRSRRFRVINLVNKSRETKDITNCDQLLESELLLQCE
ncbi:hypothetical protein RRF57_000685 [Xylaria bambusicola]|uniref:Uncharacterized protein n=1 Tax=Xylaria bambusicola TaxID=326684 RepID=A0AAN7U494_9PEZI